MLMFVSLLIVIFYLLFKVDKNNFVLEVNRVKLN